MKTSKQEKLTKEGVHSYDIKVTKLNNGIEDDSFIIPVVDVRDGREARGKANRIIKATRSGSQYLKPSFSVIGKSYQASHKY